MPKVTDSSPNMGCDPEFFFKLNGEIVGAEKFIPKAGITVAGGYNSKFIIDGVQAELNPAPNTCRANLANELVRCFKTLVTELKKTGKEGFTADFSRTIEISKEHLMELDESSRKFGCAPSKSIYKRSVGMKIEDVDPTKYRTRAAGGHIHIGTGYDNLINVALTKDYERTVVMLDLLVGNTSVLVDRDKGNIERRRCYGKAGEYRLPKHGLEYRTLSNFWLTSYPLMSFAFGMVRFAIQVMSCSHTNTLYKAFTSKVKAGNVKRAINYNDFDLAMENFKAIEDLIVDTTANKSERYAIHGDNIKDFHHFVDMINQLGINYWFPDDPIKHWTTIGECHKGGFHDYLVGHVRKDKRTQEEEVIKRMKSA